MYVIVQSPYMADNYISMCAVFLLIKFIQGPLYHEINDVIL